MRALVAVASQHGATREIADMIGATIAGRGIETDICEIEDAPALAGYDAFVVGSAVYMGGWVKSARAFVEAHADELATRPTWLFSSGPVGDPPKPDSETAVKVEDLVAAVHAREHRLFSGRLEMRPARPRPAHRGARGACRRGRLPRLGRDRGVGDGDRRRDRTRHGRAHPMAADPARGAENPSVQIGVRPDARRPAGVDDRARSITAR